MKKLWSILLLLFVLTQATSWANSVTLINDTPYTLQATIYDANGNMLGEFTLNPQGTTLWSDDDQNFGTENQYASQIPYTVNWYCMNGGSYGVCDNVAAGSTVTAQGCGGAQECPQQPMRSSY